MAVDQLRAGDATRAGGALGRPAPRRVPGRWPAAIPARALSWAPVVAATALAAALRLSHFKGIPPNPYYDAAVRSMALSWHNFLFGAFEPGGSVSIDKPPVDLWLQVASVKLLGFGSWQLRLPAVIAGIAAVPLLYAVLRALDGRVAALTGALALAVLPIAVLTDRSDTMDSVMVALDLVAVLLVVRTSRSQRPAALIAAGAVLGLAFNVKLLEALIVVPALVVLFWLHSPVPRLTRLGALTAAGGAFVAVALSWLVLVTVLPGSKPFAIGSTSGSPWQSSFVFNGVARAGRHLHLARNDLPGADRLFRAGGRRYRSLVGIELGAALVLGALAVLAALSSALAALDGRDSRRGDRPHRAGAIAFAVWLLTGVAVLSTMRQLHPRYVEAIAPAVAGCFGLAVAALARRGWSAATALRAAGPRVAVAVATAVFVAALLASPLSSSIAVVNSMRSDSGRPGALPAATVSSLSDYLARRTRTARYEFASASALYAGPLIVRDARPVLILDTVKGHRLTSVRTLRDAVGNGDVRYALISTTRCKGKSKRVACVGAVGWAHRHGRAVARRAGLPRKLELVELRLRPNRSARSRTEARRARRARVRGRRTSRSYRGTSTSRRRAKKRTI